jgi:hypothetical protein
MPKKKNTKKDQQGSGAADAVEAVRNAAAGTQERTRKLVDEVGAAAARIRDTIEDLRVLDEVKGLRKEVEALSRRVATLERDGAATPAPRAKAAPKTSRSTGTRSAASKASSTRSAASKSKASPTRSPASKPAGTRSTASKRAGSRTAASKPRTGSGS